MRTGLTVIGLGFIVARFGLFLSLLRHDTAGTTHVSSTLIGVGLVLLGSAAIAMAAWQHARFCRELGPESLRTTHGLNWSVWFAAILAVVGVVLAGYIVLRSGPG